MIGCRVIGVTLTAIGGLGFAASVNAGRYGGCVLESVTDAQSFIDSASPIFGDYGSVPVSWLLQTVGAITVFAMRASWIVFVPVLVLGILLIVKRRWHTNSYGRPLLDGIGFISLVLPLAWNSIACTYVFRSFAESLHRFVTSASQTERQAAPSWATTPLWCRSMICWFTLCICLSAVRRVWRREYVGMYWVTAAVLLTTADNCASMLVSGFTGSVPVACVIACWPAAAAAAGWMYFLKSERAAEYFD